MKKESEGYKRSGSSSGSSSGSGSGSGSGITKQRILSLFPLLCNLSNHMANDYVERIKSVCFLSHPWSKQEASL